MSQVLASPVLSSARSGIVTGRRSSTPTARPSQLLVCNSIRGSQFRAAQQSRSTAGRAQACRPQGFCGPAGGWGVRMGPSGFNVSPADLERLQQDFESWFGTGNTSATNIPSSGLSFPVDVAEQTDAYTFIADLPGVSRTDTKVQANRDDRMLAISGERSAPELTNEQKGMRRKTERRFGKFKRTFKLPEDADLNGITARFDNGVLSVTVKRVKPVEPSVTDIPISDWLDKSADQA